VVPSDRDVVTAVFGAATALSGLLLVFLGITVSAFQSYSAAVPAAAVAPYRRAARGILAAFLVGLGSAVVGLVWLLSPSRALRDAAIVLFFVQLAAVAVSAVTVARLVLWR
jgi:cell division protein FtsW (lipid II flippase)